MKYFRTEPPAPPRSPAPPEKPAAVGPRLPMVEGWPEAEASAVFNAAPAKLLKRGEKLFGDVPRTESFFVLFDGALQVTVKLNDQPGWPVLLQKGDCVAPLVHYPGLSYAAEAETDSVIVEISAATLKQLSAGTQLFIYKVAETSGGKIEAYLRAANSELSSRTLRLSQYILNDHAARNRAVQSDFVQAFIRNMRRLPAYAMNLAAKLLDDETSVQEVVEGIRSDPSLVALVLRTVNSAQYGFSKKIESFYHACMILGFNNIYNLLIREATQSTMPITRDTTATHKHSCLISVLCFEIIPTQSEQQSQTAATIGLLHDLGKGVQVVMKTQQSAKADFIETLDTAKLGASLLRAWGIPERICKIVEFQQHPEFMPPDLIAPEYRREVAALHIAHALEGLLTSKPLDPSRNCYTPDYMSVLGFGNMSPQQLLDERVLPSLNRSRVRIPAEIHSLVIKPQTVIS